MSEWKTIDSAPRDRTVIVGFDPEYASELSPELGFDLLEWSTDRWIVAGYGYVRQPTHWMPLPAPPEA